MRRAPPPDCFVLDLFGQMLQEALNAGDMPADEQSEGGGGEDEDLDCVTDSC
jgi:hypothetical protein